MIFILRKGKKMINYPVERLPNPAELNELINIFKNIYTVPHITGLKNEVRHYTNNDSFYRIYFYLDNKQNKFIDFVFVQRYYIKDKLRSNSEHKRLFYNTPHELYLAIVSSKLLKTL